MAFYLFFWTDEREQHVADHGITREEFEEVVNQPEFVTASRSTGRSIAFGWTSTGKYLAAIYQMIDDVTVEPITAYEVKA